MSGNVWISVGYLDKIFPEKSHGPRGFQIKRFIYNSNALDSYEPFMKSFSDSIDATSFLGSLNIIYLVSKHSGKVY